jgi:hypothetical protein
MVSVALVWMAPLDALAQSGSSSPDFRQLVDMPYAELLENAAALRYSEAQIESLRKKLEKEEDAEKDRLKAEEKQIKEQVDFLRDQLKSLNGKGSRDSASTEASRQDLHCSIVSLERKLVDVKARRDKAVDLAYDNKYAKLDLIREWPAKKREIDLTIDSEAARQRRFGDVEDIGVRVLAKDQEDDIKKGEEAIQQMKAYGLMPPELEDKEVKAYVQRLADRIAASSDLKVPVRTTVLDSEEINAFALPGGFLFVNSGLIRKADTESELVGVLAHELAHSAARHGARLMKRATIANMFFQGAQIAAAILTGGVSTMAAYYALQYGFYGLGMVLDLALLGVSRDYESEADQLGVQYAWTAGYAPLGFTTFFDKMASEEGYVRSASFFRTHPPFYDRIISTFSEIEFLPPKADLKVDSTEFHDVKDRIVKLEKETEPERRNRPTLRRGPQCPEADSDEIDSPRIS